VGRLVFFEKVKPVWASKRFFIAWVATERGTPEHTVWVVDPDWKAKVPVLPEEVKTSK
jgi:hypothetical protein